MSGCVIATSKGYPHEYKTGFPIKIGKIDSNNCQIFDSVQSDVLPYIIIHKTYVGGFKSHEVTFKEYEFNIDDLPEFKYYRFKFVLTSTNQTYVPRVSDLRVITLA